MMDKRRFVASCAGLASALAWPGALLWGKKKQRTPIQNHPFYRYLMDHELRVQEKGGATLEIRDAEFRGTEFINGKWSGFRFFNCHFFLTGMFQQDVTEKCDFYNCDFGPGGKDVIMKLGDVSKNRFFSCQFVQGNLNFGRGETYIQDCTFMSEPATQNSWNHFVSGHDLTFVNSTFRYYGMLIRKRVHLKGCDYLSSGTRPIMPDEDDHTVDFIFEDTIIADAEKFLWNSKIKSLTLNGTNVKGSFCSQHGSIKDFMLLENIKVGTYWLARTDTENNITVRNCQFSEVDKTTGHIFSCCADNAREVLIDRVECTNAGGFDLTWAGDGVGIQPTFRLDTTRNQNFIIRDCKIPLLYINWLQTFNLVIENCEFDKVDLKDGRLGNVTIRNTTFKTLDITRTLAAKFDIDKASAKSGQIIQDESNYPKGGYQIK